MFKQQQRETALILFSCRHVKYNLVHGPYDPLSGSIFQVFDVLMTIFKAIADVPVESFKAVKATKTASTSTDVNNKAGPSGSSTRGSARSSNTARQLSSSNNMNKAQALPVAQNFLARDSTPPPGYRAEEESEDELEADLDVAELPGEPIHEDELEADLYVAELPEGPIHEDFLTRSSSDTNMGSVVKSRQSSISDNDRSSVRTSSTHAGLKYIGNAVKGTGVGLSKSAGRLTLEGLKAPLETLSIVAYGFHNAPKLWGDDVRPLDRITGAGSGLKVASKVSQ